MPKRSGEGPPWPKDSEEKDVIPVGGNSGALARADKYLDTEWANDDSVVVEGAEERAGTPEITMEEVIEGFGRSPDAESTDDAQKPGKSERDERRQQRGRKSAASETGTPLSVNEQGQPTPSDTNTSEELGTSQTKAASMEEYLEMTRSEKIKRLSEKLAGFKKPEGSNRKELRNALYEHRASALTEKAHLTEARQAMLSAEVAYYEARKLAYKEGTGPDTLGDLKQAYHQALFSWNTALSEAAEYLEGKDRIDALVLRKRDTILRPKNLEIEAKRAGMDAKVWYSIDKWMNEDTPMKMAQALNVPSSVAGKGLAWAFHKSARGKGIENTMRQAELARSYARAARIIAGAGFATAIAISATPVAASGALLTFAVYGARGTLGLVAGMGGAKASGSIYQRLVGSKKRSQLNFADNARNAFSNLEDYQAFQERYGKQNVNKRAREKAVWQMLGAMAAGGSVGVASSPIAHIALDQMGDLKSVQHASDTLEHTEPTAAAKVEPADSQDTPSVEMTSGTRASAPEAYTAPAAPEGPFLREVSIGKGEGFNQLFADFRNSGFNGSLPSVAMLLNPQLSLTELSERIGAFDPETGESMVMLEGDKLVIDAEENVWFVRNGESQLLLENRNGQLVEHKLEGMEMRASNPITQALVKESVPESDESVPQETTLVHPIGSSVETTEVPYVATDTTPSEQIEESVAAPALEADSGDTEGLIPRATLGGTNEGSDTQTPAAPLKTQSLESWAQASIEADASMFSNAHGVEINPSEPAGYEWRIPGTNASFTVAYGENEAATERWALRELELHPESKVLMNYTEANASTGAMETSVGAWQMRTDGTPEFVREVLNPENGQKLGAANPQDFIRKLS